MTNLTRLDAGWPSGGGGEACEGGLGGRDATGGGGLAAGPDEPPPPDEPVGNGLRAGFAMILLSDGAGAGDAAGEGRTLNGEADL